MENAEVAWSNYKIVRNTYNSEIEFEKTILLISK